MTHRNVAHQESAQLLREWETWMQGLKCSKYPHVRQALSSARALTMANIDEFIRNRVAVERELKILKNSSRQLDLGDEELISQLVAGPP
ncbi:hypothetical protein K457DRAFT_23586 [Linnemannia elongata AG-77]|uniref:Uncharacterized protein n=1 Tax=Linnemannia elongata AG-77 TaxID=1314771 RepID=A0A197JII3_9FUNG|nr:hypothetical protein K457DRAFT_23586 [Linnemannia elongata AG-77]